MEVDFDILESVLAVESLNLHRYVSSIIVELELEPTGLLSFSTYPASWHTKSGGLSSSDLPTFPQLKDAYFTPMTNSQAFHNK